MFDIGPAAACANSSNRAGLISSGLPWPFEDESELLKHDVQK